MTSENNDRKKRTALAGVGIGTLLIASSLMLSVGVPANQQSVVAQQQQSENATTIANTTTTDTFKGKGLITGSIQEGSGTNQSSSNPYLVAGQWRIDVGSGNVTDFGANFTMVRTDGSEHHAHDITNFKLGNNTSFQLDPTAKSTINGTADYTVNGTSKWPGTDTIITIEKARILTIQPNENEAKQHFQTQPIYGIVTEMTGENGTQIATTAPSGGNQTQQDGGILDLLTKPFEDLFGDN
jgi:hypothetical protein